MQTLRELSRDKAKLETAHRRLLRSEVEQATLLPKTKNAAANARREAARERELSEDSADDDASLRASHTPVAQLLRLMESDP